MKPPLPDSNLNAVLKEVDLAYYWLKEGRAGYRKIAMHHLTSAIKRLRISLKAKRQP